MLLLLLLCEALSFLHGYPALALQFSTPTVLPSSSSSSWVTSATALIKFFFFLIPSCHQSVLLKFFASSSDLLHQFLSFFLLLFFFSLQIHARISNRKIKFHQRLTIGPAYGLNNFSSQTSVQVVLSYFLYSRFSCIKNYFDERFTVNLVETYGSVRV